MNASSPLENVGAQIQSAVLRTTLALSILLAGTPSSAQTVQWRRALGTSGDDAIWASAPDGLGGVYVSGFTAGSLGGPSAGGHDAWLARYDAAGNRLWIRQSGSSANDWSSATAADGSQGVYFGGSTWGDFGGPNVGQRDNWLARLDGSGNQLWIAQFGTSAKEWLADAAPDAAGGVVVCGDTHGSLGGPNVGNQDSWLARFDGTGNRLWIRQLGSGAHDWALGIFQQSGGVYACGTTKGDLGGPSSGDADAWLVRYDLAGTLIWIRQLGTSASDWAYSVAGDPSGRVYVSGTTHGAIGGPNAGFEDVWIACYDTSGNQLWVRQIGSSARDAAVDSVHDGAGGVVVVGYTDRNLGGPSAGYTDAWVSRFDSSGTLLWIRQLGSSAQDFGMAATSDSAGGIFLGGTTLTGTGVTYHDAWLARLIGH